MSEWWTYTLSDFLLFSPLVYYRLFEIHNRALWPAQIATLALGLVVMTLLWWPTRARDRVVPAILGALWLFIAWSFVWERYATINWAAPYVAPAFALEGLLLIWPGALGNRSAFAAERDPLPMLGLVLFALCLFGYPLLPWLAGRPWWAAEVFGVAPDPTAAATLAALALARGRVRWALMIVPLLWCAITGATLWAMEAGDFFVAPALALGALATMIMRRQRQSKATGASA
jgi:uncharacterized protein DUF6064